MHVEDQQCRQVPDKQVCTWQHNSSASSRAGLEKCVQDDAGVCDQNTGEICLHTLQRIVSVRCIRRAWLRVPLPRKYLIPLFNLNYSKHEIILLLSRSNTTYTTSLLVLVKW